MVVFDGGMGATLEQLDLTEEDYGGLQGKCHEALVLNRPDVIQSARVISRPAPKPCNGPLPGQPHQVTSGAWASTRPRSTQADEARALRAGEDRFVAGSSGPTGHSRPRPSLAEHLRELSRCSRAGRGLVEGGVD